MLHKIFNFRRIYFLDFCQYALFSACKLSIAQIKFLYAFKICAQLIRPLYNLINLIIPAKHISRINLLQVSRKHIYQPSAGYMLQFLIRLFYFGIIVFYRSGQIARYNFTCLMEHSYGSCFVSINIPVKKRIADNSQRMRQHSSLKRMLLNVFLAGIAHKPPALYIFHSGHIGKKMIHRQSFP